MRFLFLLLLGFSLLQAERFQFHREQNKPPIPAAASAFSAAEEPEIQPQVLYLIYEKVPSRVFKGEIFAITLKVLSTAEYFEDIDYAFEGGHGCRLLTPVPERRTEGRYYYDTFYFRATAAALRTPDLEATIRYHVTKRSKPVSLKGRTINVVTLNPPKDFSHILADSFEVIDYKTTRYNQEYNTAIFNARATRSDIEALHFDAFERQGADSVMPSHHESTITYYAIIPRKMEELKFSYFDLQRERFREVVIPIIVEDDSVSTQSDLRPTEHGHTLIKISVAAVIGVIALILYFVRRHPFYLVFVIGPAVYIADAAVPIEYACIKPESPIYLLPMKHSTTFEVTRSQYRLEVQGHIENYTKVKLPNNKIGWVSNEDLCRH